jgi:hypothetical protein
MRSRGRVLGQRPAGGLASFEALHGDLRPLFRRLRRRFRLGGILLEVSQLKLELIEDRTALGGLPEPLVAQLDDRVFELLDQQRAMLRLGLGGKHHGLERRNVVGKRIRSHG